MKINKMTLHARYLRVVVFGIVCLCAFRNPTSAEDTNFIEILKVVYDFDSWSNSTATNYSRALTNWQPDFAAIGVTNITSSNIDYIAEGVVNRIYSFPDPQTPAVFINVAIEQRESVLSSHEAMIRQFSKYSGPQPLTNALSMGITIGDRCYVGFGNRSRLYFCRNNVFLRVAADDFQHAVTNLAQSLDQQVLNASIE